MSKPDAISSTPEPGYNRFKVARDIQNACNTSGVARELIRVIENAATTPMRAWAPRARPGRRAVIDKLALMRSTLEAHGECARRAV